MKNEWWKNVRLEDYHTMTKKEWDKCSRDYKEVMPDGTKTVLINQNGATVLTPVRIIN